MNSWSFTKNSFIHFMVKNFESHSVTMLYPNLSYNEVCYILLGKKLYYGILFSWNPSVLAKKLFDLKHNSMVSET